MMASHCMKLSGQTVGSMAKWMRPASTEVARQKPVMASLGDVGETARQHRIGARKGPRRR